MNFNWSWNNNGHSFNCDAMFFFFSDCVRLVTNVRSWVAWIKSVVFPWKVFLHYLTPWLDYYQEVQSLVGRTTSCLVPWLTVSKNWSSPDPLHVTLPNLRFLLKQFGRGLAMVFQCHRIRIPSLSADVSPNCFFEWSFRSYFWCYMTDLYVLDCLPAQFRLLHSWSASVQELNFASDHNGKLT